jgi:hypothetical protein
MHTPRGVRTVVLACHRVRTGEACESTVTHKRTVCPQGPTYQRAREDTRARSVAGARARCVGARTRVRWSWVTVA